MTQERAREAREQAKKLAVHGPWSDQLRKVLTAEEYAEVKALWDTMPGNTCFMDAFFRILNGK